MPTKKTAKKVAKKAAKKATAGASTRQPGRLEGQAEKITKLRDGGKNWSEIAEAVGATVGQVIFAYEKANVKPSEKIRDISGKDVVRLRKEGVSWGRIAVRGGIRESKARAMFEETSGNPSLGNRIGKGGRHPAGSNVVSLRDRAAAKKAAKVPAGTAKKAAKSVSKTMKKAAKRPVKKAAATTTTA